VTEEEYKQYEKEIDQRTGMGCLIALLMGVVGVLYWILSGLF